MCYFDCYHNKLSFYFLKYANVILNTYLIRGSENGSSRTILRQHFIATRFCRNIVHFAHDVAIVLYFEKKPDSD